MRQSFGVGNGYSAWYLCVIAWQAIILRHFHGVGEPDSDHFQAAVFTDSFEVRTRSLHALSGIQSKYKLVSVSDH